MPRIFWLISTLSLMTGPLALAQIPPVGEVQEFALPSAMPTGDEPAFAVSPVSANQPGTSQALPTPMPQPSTGDSGTPTFNHQTQYHAAPEAAPAAVNCSACAATCRRPCDLHALCEWLCYRPRPCGHACKS